VENRKLKMLSKNISHYYSLLTIHYMTTTNQQYDTAIKSCKDIFLKKAKDYGTAWRVLRTISIVDQIFIKAQRIRTIQEKGEQKVSDGIAAEFKGIINYAVIGLIQLELPGEAAEELEIDKVSTMYDKQVEVAKQLMQDKNHDYGEAWRSMSQESFVDLILMKLQRIRQILSNDGKTIMSEGIDANYHDIINYAVFALILM
jgi:Nucleotide modification associated domain 1